MACVLALDQGTTSSRAILFDHEGAIVAVAQKEFQQIFPKTGWVEHDPNEIWTSQISVAIEALGKARVRPRDIVAAGITNQRETTIIWDRESGQPVYNAIVWQDRRTAAFCEQLKAEGHEPLIQERTGLLVDAYFSGSKVRWILDNVPGVRERAEAGKLAFGTVDSWLVWKLAGGRKHLTDASNASRTMLFNIHTGTWDEDLLRLFQIPSSLLPEVRSSSEVYAEVSTTLGLEHDSHRWHRGRSASCLVWPDVSFSRTDQEYLWDRLFHATKHGYEGSQLAQPPADNGRMENEPASRILPGRQRFHWRRGGTVVAGWAGDYPVVLRS